MPNFKKFGNHLINMDAIGAIYCKSGDIDKPEDDPIIAIKSKTALEDMLMLLWSRGGKELWEYMLLKVPQDCHL